MPIKNHHHGNDLLNACYFGNTSDALRLLAKGADVHFVDYRDGWAGIHYAARWGRTRIVEALMQAGVSINLKTTGKENALHKACRSNRKDTIIWMILNGADPNMLNSNGERPGDLAMCDTCKYIANNFTEFRTRWHAMGKDLQPLRQSKTAVSKTSCDIIYDIDWEIMSSDIVKAQALALAEIRGQRSSPMRGERGSMSSPSRAIAGSPAATRATAEINRLRSAQRHTIERPTSPRK